ncbi:hypothetical protein MY04_1306 [Flammeovirga sp. MY04]|uniref:hypothetical protein n=1 Tax=Flammeovirga sp. MY04 TaxID=1191459 RepID=UPI000806155D|nr:hypothetical protein [Flammeovirga sp. MY04]ANQ48683.1 hypothetical protein MY04_1306 [Flammeovirga sp. MY04]
MKQIVLNIKEGKFKFFMELIQNLDFVQIQESGDQNEVKTDIKEAIKELNLIKEGKIEAKDADDLINEL